MTQLPLRAKICTAVTKTTRSSATAKSTASPSCLVGVLCVIFIGRKSVDGYSTTFT